MSTTRILLLTGAAAAATAGLGYWHKKRIEAEGQQNQPAEQPAEQKSFRDFLESAPSFVKNKIEHAFRADEKQDQEDSPSKRLT